MTLVTVAGRDMEPLFPGEHVIHCQVLVGTLSRSLAASYILGSFKITKIIVRRKGGLWNPGARRH